MDRNRDVSVARRYHEATCHTRFSVHTSGHSLDWDIQPLPFKIYEDLAPIPLAPHFHPLEVPALGLGAPPASLTLTHLAQLLFYSAGITRKRTSVGGGALDFRAAACTGALYEIDLYVACGELGDNAAAGLYHFSPHDFCLRRLREGDWRATVASACALDSACEAFVLSGATFWRNAWKYEARTYRHFGWDGGTILANLDAVACALGVRARILSAFVDESLNRLLGLDGRREVTCSVVALGQEVALPSAPEPAPLSLVTRALSSREVDYPLMRELHEASSLDTAQAVREWRAASAAPPRPSFGVPVNAHLDSPRTLHETILRRGSSRRFQRAPIQMGQLSTILRPAANGGRPFVDTFAPLCEMYLIVNAVDGFEHGAWYCGFGDGTLQLQKLKTGDFRREAEYLDLEQELAGDAAVNVYFMVHLEEVLEACGNRGYRAAQLEAGIRGGRIYLAAYALGIGATGLTFYDEEVTRFFSPHAAGRTPMFLVAAGVPARRHVASRAGAVISS